MGGTSTAGGAQRCSCPRETAATRLGLTMHCRSVLPLGSRALSCWHGVRAGGMQRSRGHRGARASWSWGRPGPRCVCHGLSRDSPLLPAPPPSACSWLSRACATYTTGSYQPRNRIRGNRHRGSHAFLNACPPHRTEQGPLPPAAQKPGQWPPSKFSFHNTHRRSRLGSHPAFSHRGERMGTGTVQARCPPQSWLQRCTGAVWHRGLLNANTNSFLLCLKQLGEGNYGMNNVRGTAGI